MSVEAQPVGARGASIDIRRLWSLGWRAMLVVALLAAVPLSTVPLLDKFHVVAMYDFRGGLYNAGTAILHGLNPYHAGFLAHQAAIMRAGGVAIGETTFRTFSLPVYPAPANLAVIPLSLLPFWAAGAIYGILSVVSIVLALWWLEVRDWRCFALTLLSWPFIFGLMIGALGPFIVLGVAAAWRWRTRLWPPAIAIASIVVAKIFPWPVAVWLLVTRRYRAFALAVVIAVTVTLGAWAVIGFAGMLEYPQMLANVSFIQELRATSVVAILIALGLSPFAATGFAMAAGLGLLAAAWRATRRPGGERTALGLAIIATLTAAPIVWDHYLVLLLIPIALRSPKLSGLWFLPLTGPIFVTASSLIVPFSNKVHATRPETLRNAIVWVTIEAIVTISLYASAADVAGLRRRVAMRLRGAAGIGSGRGLEQPVR